MAESRGRVRTWDVARPRGAPWVDIPAALDPLREVLRRWLATDVAAGRLMPWLPVAFGFGIVLYFTAEREPKLWAVCAAATGFAVAAFLARSRPVAFPALLGVTAIAAGFAAVTLKAALIAHPILQRAAWNVSLTGFVEVREERERTDRIVVRVYSSEGRLDEAPERVRLSIRKHTAPPVGAFIELKARLNPPLRPLRPGGYDFSRDLYFQRIGATGFALGSIKTLDPPTGAGLWLRYATVVQGIRDAIDARIRAAVPGDAGAEIASRLPVISAEAMAPLSPGTTARMRASMASRRPLTAVA